MLALGGARLWLLDPEAKQVIAAQSPPRRWQIAGACFTSNATVVTQEDARPGGVAAAWWGPGDRYAVRSYLRAGPRLRPRATAHQVQARHAYPGEPQNLIAATGHGGVALLSGGVLRCYDASTLTPTDRPLMPGRLSGTFLCGSADGRYLAVGGGGFVEIADTHAVALAELLDRPMAMWRPGDLATVDQAERLFGERPEAERLGGLMRACLEYRFT